MTERISYLLGEGHNPFENIALEEELLLSVGVGECILYLWQNKNTVVIGRNQNCRRECDLEALERDGGLLARRLSGGGAVYHDLGNLNFTFLVRDPDYDLVRQSEVILRAARGLGVAAERTGRNDIAAQGRKFSGNAFYSSCNRRYHHGTILVDSDMARLSRYLRVQPDKLRSNGVRSVRSRVVNLRELVPGLTVEKVQNEMLSAFGEVYGLTPTGFDSSRLDEARLLALTAKFASREWRIGVEPKQTCSANRRFGWGGVELCLTVGDSRVTGATVFTDAMESDLARLIEDALAGAEFTSGALAAAMLDAAKRTPAAAVMLHDVATLIEELV